MLYKLFGNSVFRFDDVLYELNPMSYLDRQLIIEGSYEDEVFEIIKSHLKDGGVFIDIGANFGLYTIKAATIPNVYIFSFEPSKRELSRLYRNVSLNKLTNITIFPFGLSEENYTADLNIFNNSNQGMNSLLNSFSAMSKERVQCFSMDRLLHPSFIATVKVIKMDVEGFEYNVLLGMAESLDLFNGTIILEITYYLENTQNNYNPDLIYELLLSKGFYSQYGKRYSQQYNDVFSKSDPLISEKPIREQSSFSEVIVTLYERTYYLGVAALVNSLVKSSFEGLVYVGYKDVLPPWISQLDPPVNQYFKLESLHLKFIKIDVSFHLGYYKPFFLLETLSTYPSAKRIFYFDPDIVVNAPWHFFSKWVKCGVSLCIDNCFQLVPNSHPWRNDWRELDLASDNYVRKEIDYYVNSGFIGLERENILLLEKWKQLTEKYRDGGGNLTIFEKDGYRSFKGDQDLLNAAITITAEIQYSIIGSEGMGFSEPSYLMTHAVGNIKPWNKNYLRSLIKYGHKPSRLERNFFAFSKYPIQVFSRYQSLFKGINLKAAIVLGRLIGQG